MTTNREDYLKQLYRLEEAEGSVSNKRLSEALGIAPASVSEMLVKLGKEGLVQYEAYQGTRLIEEGRRRAVDLLRGHRLWEVFLREHLGYSWSEAHEDAELLEHVTPARLVERLDTYLNHPAHCPHGEPIPRGGDQAPRAELVALSEVPAGRRVILRKVREERALMDYLEAMELHLDAEAVVTAVGAYEGPVALLTEGKDMQLSHKAAERIFVEEIESRRKEDEDQGIENPSGGGSIADDGASRGAR